MKLAVSRADIIMIILAVIFGMSLWVWVDQVVDVYLSDEAPQEEVFQQQQNVSRLERARAANENALKVSRERLDQLQRSVDEKAALLDTLIALYPHIAVLTTTPISPSTVISSSLVVSPSLSTDYAQVFLDARLKQDVDRRLIVTTTNAMTQTEMEIDRISTELRLAQQTAARQFHRAQLTYQFIKPVATFAIAVIAVFLLFFLITVIHRIIRRRSRVNHNPTSITFSFLVAMGLLLILFGFQAFYIAGAALMTLFVLVMSLIFIPWPAVAARNITEDS